MSLQYEPSSKPLHISSERLSRSGFDVLGFSVRLFDLSTKRAKIEGGVVGVSGGSNMFRGLPRKSKTTSRVGPHMWFDIFLATLGT